MASWKEFMAKQAANNGPSTALISSDSGVNTPVTSAFASGLEDIGRSSYYSTPTPGISVASFQLSDDGKSRTPISNNVDMLSTKPNAYTDGSYTQPAVSESLIRPPVVQGLGGALAADAASKTPWYKDGGAMQGYAGLANSLVGLATLGPQLKAYKQNLKESEHNLARAKVAAGRKDEMYSNINAPMAGAQNV